MGLTFQMASDVRVDPLRPPRRQLPIPALHGHHSEIYSAVGAFKIFSESDFVCRFF